MSDYAIIFGANGQTGFYLTKACAEQSLKVVGISRTGTGYIGDVRDFECVKSIIQKYRPRFIFHLAANSTIQHDALFENHETISTGTLNILECVKDHSPNSKVFVVGSGMQFENNGQPISELTAFRGNSPYAVARIQSTYAARYFRSLGIATYVGHLFHHESPLRRSHHMSQRIVNFVKKLREGQNPAKIEVGDISVEKEWGFAGDIANGILTLVQQDDSFEATIGTGLAYSIKHWLELCFSSIKKDWKDYVQPIQGFKPDFSKLVSDPTTMHTMGWVHKTSISELARLMLEHNEA